MILLLINLPIIVLPYHLNVTNYGNRWAFQTSRFVKQQSKPQTYFVIINTKNSKTHIKSCLMNKQKRLIDNLNCCSRKFLLID